MEDPFPAEQTNRIRDFAWDITEAHRCYPDEGEEVQKQPILVLLLGSVMKAMGDPDWKIMGKYAVGVPLGVGVDLPRTPEAFPPKLRWSLPEQVEWGGASERAKLFQGSARRNYSSAVEHAVAVEKVLREQAGQDRVIVLPEAVAKERYGDLLTIASLGAIVKMVDEDGEVIEVRVIHDGTNGVDINRFIKVLDGALFPLAADVKTALRVQTARGRPHWGMAVDINGAHRRTGW